jgi:cell division protein FtsB
VVPAPPWRAPLTPFVLVAVGLVVTGLIALLLLNTLVAEDSFRVRQLEQETTALREREQVLLAQVARLDAPAELARRARALGMVQAGSPAFIRLSDRRFLGSSRPAEPPVRKPR